MNGPRRRNTLHATLPTTEPVISTDGLTVGATHKPQECCIEAESRDTREDASCPFSKEYTPRPHGDPPSDVPHAWCGWGAWTPLQLLRRPRRGREDVVSRNGSSTVARGPSGGNLMSLRRNKNNLTSPTGPKSLTIPLHYFHQPPPAESITTMADHGRCRQKWPPCPPT